MDPITGAVIVTAVCAAGSAAISSNPEKRPKKNITKNSIIRKSRSSTNSEE